MSKKPICDQTCKGICTSLDAAAASETKAIVVYERLREQCTFPDIREMLEVLIARRQEILRLVDETRRRIRERFDVLDKVRESYETP